jgi:hypothetical protein
MAPPLRVLADSRARSGVQYHGNVAMPTRRGPCFRDRFLTPVFGGVTPKPLSQSSGAAICSMSGPPFYTDPGPPTTMNIRTPCFWRCCGDQGPS